jgi:16S rRNA (adenine1518-N6/adenine1519-N6)-dimethyltransferase
MADLADLPPLREIIRDYGLNARKSLGQHFLLDGNLTDKIARGAGALENKHVVEIGPGPGGLTRAILAHQPKSLHVIERDSRCIDVMHQLAAATDVPMTVVEADALAFELSSLADTPVTLISNLPYNIGTALLIKWLSSLTHIERMVLMFQKEVADRIVAEPRSSGFGRLAVISQWLCEARPLFTVDRRAFTPPPKVESSVIELVPRVQPLAEANMRNLEKVTQAAFGQRRKMLRSSLKQIGLKPSDAGIDETKRAEELTIEEFCALARLL